MPSQIRMAIGEKFGIVGFTGSDAAHPPDATAEDQLAAKPIGQHDQPHCGRGEDDAVAAGSIGVSAGAQQVVGAGDEEYQNIRCLGRARYPWFERD